MNPQKFRGTGVALVTPFKDRKIDFNALERLIDRAINEGIDYIVSLGTTGEAIALDKNERRSVYDCTLQTVAKRVPVVAGFFGRNNTHRLLEYMKTFNYDGFDAIMSSSPNYVKPSQEGIFQHYKAIAEHSPLPIIIYNVPSRTSSNVLPETVMRLINADDKFFAIKEASGDLSQVQELLRLRPDHFLVVSGDDPTALATVGVGGDGVISVLGNAFPGLFSQMIRAALNGDYSKAQQINLQLFGFHRWLYCENNPAGIKALMAIQGLIENELRLPLVSVSNNTYGQLDRLFRASEVSNFV